MRTRHRLLDLFCGAGGAGAGYERLGFQVTGVDIAPQPNYPFKFIQANVFDVLKDLRFISKFDVIHASPPCYDHSPLGSLSRYRYVDLVPRTRAALQASGVHFVIENVSEQPLVNPIMLCGTMFSELRVIRHRMFESSCFLKQPRHSALHPRVYTKDRRRAQFGLLSEFKDYVQVTGGGNCSKQAAAQAMGIDWMTKAELNDAIPPAYTEFVGKCVLANLR